MVNHVRPYSGKLDFSVEPFKSISDLIDTPYDYLLIKCLLDFSESKFHCENNIIHISQKDLVEYLSDCGRPSSHVLAIYYGKLVELNQRILERTNEVPFYKLEVEFPEERTEF
jgi:hypothetical protein